MDDYIRAPEGEAQVNSARTALYFPPVPVVERAQDLTSQRLYFSLPASRGSGTSSPAQTHQFCCSGTRERNDSVRPFLRSFPPALLASSLSVVPRPPSLRVAPLSTWDDATRRTRELTHGALGRHERQKWLGWLPGRFLAPG